VTLLFAQRRSLEELGVQIQLGHLRGIINAVVCGLVWYLLSGRCVFTFAQVFELALPRSAAVVLIARLLPVHGHRAQLDRLRLLDLTRIELMLEHHFVALIDGVLFGRLRCGFDERLLGLHLSGFVVGCVSPAFEVVWVLHHLVLARIDLLIACCQLLDCFILLLPLHGI